MCCSKAESFEYWYRSWLPGFLPLPPHPETSPNGIARIAAAQHRNLHYNAVSVDQRNGWAACGQPRCGQSLLSLFSSPGKRAEEHQGECHQSSCSDLQASGGAQGSTGGGSGGGGAAAG